ncbi:hypothetical protein BpHYR1_042821 [Brachionus plicatilis]|uniref:Uncharacterized protein n=1 Tax=Brachionus plicatilis TaxID=10195 RepID=A0A3M7Q4P1_BRAPC|nr:hypothetical protein BpHYR1_042821 [Brachionus plicatilis]
MQRNFIFRNEATFRAIFQNSHRFCRHIDFGKKKSICRPVVVIMVSIETKLRKQRSTMLIYLRTSLENLFTKN